MRAVKHSVLVLFLAALLVAGGCGRQNPEPAPRAAPTANTTAEAADRGGIRITDAADRLIFRLKADEKGYKVYGQGGQLLARLKVESDRVEAEDPAGKRLLTLKQKEGKCKAEDASGAVLFEFKPHSKKTGDYKLEDASGSLLYRFKQESYGYKVTDAVDQTLFKMKAAGGRVIADGPDGRKRMEIKGSPAALAAGAAVLENFDPVRRAALYAYLSHFQRGAP